METLYFLREMICDIFTEIIINGDVTSKKIILPSDSVNATQRLLDHRKTVMTLVEGSIHQLFNGYITNAQRKSLDELRSIITCRSLSPQPQNGVNIDYIGKMTQSIWFEVEKQMTSTFK